MYFSHDTDARNEDKILGVRMELGAEGYGMYWMLLEKLASEKTHVLKLDIDKLSWDLRCDAEKLRMLICDFGLFETDEENCTFWSDGLINRMERADALSNVRSEAGRAGAEAKRRKSNLSTNDNNVSKNKQNTSSCPESDKQNDDLLKQTDKQNEDLLKQNFSKIKEIKGKEIKENKIKENLSSSKSSFAEAIEERDEAAGAAEEEEELLENDLFALWTDAHEAMKQVNAPSGTDSKQWNVICWRLSTPKKEDRSKLVTIINELARNGNNASRIVQALNKADEMKPINAMNWDYWEAIDYMNRLNTSDQKKIKSIIGRRNALWRDFACAVGDCLSSSKIVHPGRYIISRLNDCKRALTT